MHTARGKTMQAAAAAAFAAVQGEAMLILNLEPGDANLRLNGEPFGQGSGSYTLPAGKHTLAVEAPARQTVEQEIILSSGQVLRLVVDLAVVSGKLTLTPEPPQAAVFLDGVPWQTPKTARALSPGKYQLRVEADGYETFTDLTINYELDADDTSTRTSERPCGDGVTCVAGLGVPCKIGSYCVAGEEYPCPAGVVGEAEARRHAGSLLAAGVRALNLTLDLQRVAVTAAACPEKAATALMFLPARPRTSVGEVRGYTSPCPKRP